LSPARLLVEVLKSDPPRLAGPPVRRARSRQPPWAEPAPQSV